jgi:HEAT repeat protein
VNAEDAIARAARAVAPAELHAAAVAEGCRVQRKKFGPAVPLAEVYADSDALIAGVARGEEQALAAALRGLARLDGEAMVDVALALCDGGKGTLRNAAALALAHSRDERALELVLAALDGAVPRGALDRSVHPGATIHVRAVLAETGVTTFAVRPRPTLAEWRALSDDERRALAELQPKGRASPELERATTAVRVLGERQATEAVELLVRLFDAHPDDRLRYACAHALAALNDARAAAALDRRWSDADDTVASIAIGAALSRDLATAWQRFAPHVEPVLAGTASLDDEQIVATLLHRCHGGSTPRRLDPDPLVVEPRFVDLAARLRRHPQIGSTARRVLDAVPREVAFAAIEANPIAPPPLAAAALPARRDFVARYLAGEHAVWAELVGQANAIAQHPELRAEAYAVAVEIMKRARHNIDAIRTTLRESGAHVADDEPPPSDAMLARVAELGGPLPIALEAFWRVVGAASLVPGDSNRYDYGDCALEADGLSLIALDPLELGSDMTWCLDNYTSELEGSHREIVGPLALELSPDFLHKQNISGGPPHIVFLPVREPADAVDPPLRYTRYRTRFVDYLRVAFRYGGFPGIDVAHLPLDRIGLNDRIAFKGVRGSWGDAADRLLAKLRRGLVEL